VLGKGKCTTCLKVTKHDIHGSGTMHLTRRMSSHGRTSATASSTDTQTNAFRTVVDGDNVFDIDTFWHNDQVRELFPSPSQAAIGVLSIPASSVSSERMFSVTGRLSESE